jgi:hypothetical protein
MRTITAIMLRQLVLMFMSFAFLYIAFLFFGSNPNYFAWDASEKALTGIFTTIASVLLHAYWYDQKSN